MTTVADTQEALINLLRAAPTLAGVLIADAPPLDLPAENERIYGFTESDYELGHGEQFRVEAFALRLVVEVFASGSDARAASRRKWELIDELDNLLTETDFVGYYTSGLTLGVESELVAYDSGYLARSLVSIDTAGPAF